MRQLIVLAVLFFITGCNPSPSYKLSDKPLSDSEKKALAAVMDVYQRNKISVLDEYGTERQVVGAQMTALTTPEQVASHAKGMHDPHDIQKDAEPEGHLVTLVTKAKIEPKKEYSQPIINMGPDVYFYKIIYVATVDDKTLTVKKTVAIEDADQRKEEAADPDLVRNIAAAAGGTVAEDRVLLP